VVDTKGEYKYPIHVHGVHHFACKIEET